MGYLAPFSLGVHNCQINCFFCCLIIRELKLGLGVFPDVAVQVFDCVGSVDHLSDLHGVIKIIG